MPPMRSCPASPLPLLPIDVSDSARTPLTTCAAAACLDFVRRSTTPPQLFTFYQDVDGVRGRSLRRIRKKDPGDGTARLCRTIAGPGVSAGGLAVEGRRLSSSRSYPSASCVAEGCQVRCHRANDCVLLSLDYSRALLGLRLARYVNVFVHLACCSMLTCPFQARWQPSSTRDIRRCRCA